MNYHEAVAKRIQQYKPNQVIVASRLYREALSSIPEPTYYKILERMVKEKALTRLARGVYCPPKFTRFGTIPSDEREIIRYYTGENGDKGILIGYSLYNQYGLTTQVAKTTEIYSNALQAGQKTIGNIRIRRAALAFTAPEHHAIEALEILQHYGGIEELRLAALQSYLKHLAQQYNDAAAQTVLQHIRYKKRTIAFLAQVLDYFHVAHCLRQYLSGTSTYQIPTMGELYESAS